MQAKHLLTGYKNHSRNNVSENNKCFCLEEVNGLLELLARALCIRNVQGSNTGTGIGYDN
jgi:hypothetical protein